MPGTRRLTHAVGNADARVARPGLAAGPRLNMSSAGHAGMPDAPDLSPRDAMNRWLDKRRVNRTEATISTYYYRLKLFVEWCERQGVTSMGELTGWSLETYEGHRRSNNPEPITLNKEFGTLKQWLEYCARIELVADDLPEKVNVPDVSKADRVNDTKLDADAARALLDFYRGDKPGAFGSREHVLLELAWHTGARAGALAALDLRDVRESEDGTRYLAVVHRPETGTPLKKGRDGERMVTLTDESWRALDWYVEHERLDAADDHGREPLLASRVGRATPGTIRDWMYLATQPCLHAECPHGRDRDTCEWTAYASASQCPSSRAPHHVRTGAITWMRTRGVPAEVVAERVNSGVDTIQEHYDVEDPVREMLERRAQWTAGLDIQEESE